MLKETRLALNLNEPLALPNGSVRAIIALVFTGVCGFLWATNGQVPPDLLAITTLIIGNYFGQRGVAPVSDVPEEVSRPYVPGKDVDG